MVYIEPNSSNGLFKDSAADCFQIRSLSEDRFIKKIGSIDAHQLEEIKESIRQVLSMD